MSGIFNWFKSDKNTNDILPKHRENRNDKILKSNDTDELCKSSSSITHPDINEKLENSKDANIVYELRSNDMTSHSLCEEPGCEKEPDKCLNAVCTNETTVLKKSGFSDDDWSSDFSDNGETSDNAVADDKNIAVADDKNIAVADDKNIAVADDKNTDACIEFFRNDTDIDIDIGWGSPNHPRKYFNQSDDPNITFGWNSPNHSIWDIDYSHWDRHDPEIETETIKTEVYETPILNTDNTLNKLETTIYNSDFTNSYQLPETILTDMFKIDSDYNEIILNPAYVPIDKKTIDTEEPSVIPLVSVWDLEKGLISENDITGTDKLYNNIEPLVSEPIFIPLVSAWDLKNELISENDITGTAKVCDSVDPLESTSDTSDEYYVQSAKKRRRNLSTEKVIQSLDQNGNIGIDYINRVVDEIRSHPWDDSYNEGTEFTGNTSIEERDRSDYSDVTNSSDQSYTETEAPTSEIERDSFYSDDETDCESVSPIGRLELVFGPMFSGKSTAILLRLARMADVGCDVLYINHAIDNRVTEAQDSVVSTHNSQYKTLSKKINAIKVSKLLEVDVKDYQYIAIDEGQFFGDLYEAVIKWTTKYGKTIYVASLDGDAYRRKFGQVLDLIPNADKVEKLTAFCDICRVNKKELRDAPFTGRLTKNTDSTVVGGTDIYRAMCRECHNKHLNKSNE
jgi:thymidine kinase